MKHNTLVATLVGALAASGCAGFGGQQIPFGVLGVDIERSLTIPVGFAHAKFQGGRQASGVNRYNPWCELEIATVSEGPQRVEKEQLSVARVTEAFIKDYNTRAPALLGGLSCTDLVFQEGTWWFDRGAGSQVAYLRCFAPYTNCEFGPSLTPHQMREVVGGALSIRVDGEGW